MFKRIARHAACTALIGVLTASAVAAEGPQPPCGGLPHPAYARLGEPAALREWRSDALPAGWTPAACLQWSDRDFAAVIAVAGRFDTVSNAPELLARLVSTSQLKTIRYWSYSRKTWRDLLAEAVALDGPDKALKRQDFRIRDIAAGRDYFTWQEENSPASGVILRTRFHEISEGRIVFEQVNLTASRILMVTVLEPYEYRATHFIEREAGAVWRYYSLTRIGRQGGSVTTDQIASMINRSVALYRYLGGLPMEREPPGAP